ncbi:MAG: hypothetical protein Q8P11_00065 [bacterium]|nr:hypothetical protein [bacterium]
MLAISSQRGFNVLSIILTIVAIALVLGIGYLAINPEKRAADKRNKQRLSDITVILKGVEQYTRANQTIFPKDITLDEEEVCKLDAQDCSGLVDLSVVKTYVGTLPVDPTISSANSTGYAIIKTTDGHITISAPHAEYGAVVKVTW